MSVDIFLGEPKHGQWSQARSRAIGDVLNFRSPFTISDAEALVTLSQFASERGRTFIVFLDGAHEAAKSKLLHALEEHDPSMHFIIIARHVPESYLTRGTVQYFQDFTENHTDKSEKLLVLKAIRAIQENDGDALNSVSARWDSEHTDLLSTWALEAITDNWDVFNPSEIEFEGTSLPLKVLNALRIKTRNRLVIRGLLMGMIDG